MMYEQFDNRQLQYLKSKIGVEIKNRNYSYEEREELLDTVADYMLENGSFEPEPDNVILMCESIIDIITG